MSDQRQVFKVCTVLGIRRYAVTTYREKAFLSAFHAISAKFYQGEPLPSVIRTPLDYCHPYGSALYEMILQKLTDDEKFRIHKITIEKTPGDPWIVTLLRIYNDRDDVVFIGTNDIRLDALLSACDKAF